MKRFPLGWLLFALAFAACSPAGAGETMAKVLEPGFSVIQREGENGSVSGTGFLQGYNETPRAQGILDITNALLDHTLKPTPTAVESAATASPPPLAPRGVSTAVPHNPGVGDLLRNPPRPGQAVEVDAYFSGASGVPFSHPPPLPDQLVCPLFLGSVALTDQPFLAVLQYLNSTTGNVLPDDAAWLTAVTPEQTKPGIESLPQLPYRSRLRGYLGDPAFAKCEHTERIFMVESVVKVYEQEPPTTPRFGLTPPDDYAAWRRYHDARLGYSVPHPAEWQAEQVDEATTVLRAAPWRDYPLTVRVHVGETHLDQYDLTSVPPLLQGRNGWGVFQQGWSFGENKFETQQLDGYAVEREARPGEGAVAVLFSGSGRTYELLLRYPTGFGASQPLLTTFTAMVEGFRLDVRPGPSPTPPIKQMLGNGPFITHEEAFAHMRANAPDAQLLEAKLVSEAQARAGESNSPCGSFEGHPDGVWLLTLRGTYENAPRVMELLLDATTGKQLCGQEVVPNATPYPTMPPGVTATPVLAEPTDAPIR